MSTHQFNAAAELEKLRECKRIARQLAYYQSRLDRHRAELVALRKAGASFREITLWLRQFKHVKITHTTVMRYLLKLPELQSPLSVNELMPNSTHNDSESFTNNI